MPDISEGFHHVVTQPVDLSRSCGHLSSQRIDMAHQNSSYASYMQADLPPPKKEERKPLQSNDASVYKRKRHNRNCTAGLLSSVCVCGAKVGGKRRKR